MTTLHEINEKAFAALREALDPVEYVRYIQQYTGGHGDYTKERQQRPQEDVQTIHRRLKEMEAAGLLPPPPPNARVLNVESPRN